MSRDFIALWWGQSPELVQPFHLRRLPALGPTPARPVHHQPDAESGDGAEDGYHSGYPAEEAKDEAEVKVVKVLGVAHPPDEVGRRKSHDVGVVHEQALEAHPRVVLAGSFGHGSRHVLVLCRGRLKGRFNNLTKV